jgi:hypothetical protein
VIQAIDTVVNLWTPEALARRGGPMRDFFVDKIGIEDSPSAATSWKTSSR